MLRYRLHTLLLVLALGPPVLAGVWWSYGKWRAEQERRRAEMELQTEIITLTVAPAVEVP